MNKPETAKEALALWDDGQIVWTIEMGGLGPGYEQCIQITVFEIVRDCLAGLPNTAPLPDPSLLTKDPDSAGTGSRRTGSAAEKSRKIWDAWARPTLDRVNVDLLLSGAQVGAAKSLALTYLRDGWAKTVDSFPDDRRIQVRKEWPHLREWEDAETVGKAFRKGLGKGD